MFPLLLSNNSYKLILILIKQILPMEKNSRWSPIRKLILMSQIGWKARYSKTTKCLW
jgi:hypothetical protein